MKEQNKTPEKELNETKITDLSDAEFKTLVIRILKELTEHSNNIKEEMKVTLSEKSTGKQNEGEQAGIQTNDLEPKEPKNNQSEQE